MPISAQVMSSVSVSVSVSVWGVVVRASVPESSGNATHSTA
ncbi:hypothetical protein [Streptomyces kanamyceticus]|nr:hypothetical protein [Streptomyces kanamyceticus]